MTKEKKPKKEKRPQTPEEEKWNALTHGLGIVLIVIFFPFLLLRAYRGNLSDIAGLVMFGLGMLLSYTSSTLYHLQKNPERKKKLRVFDHISIFFLIGGTYSAIVQQYVPAQTAFIFMVIMWSIIVAGAILKIFFTGKYQWLSVSLYLLLGWMAVFIARPLNAHMTMYVFIWVLAGGLAYTFGVIFYKNQKLKYSHAIWHMFVLAGTFLHFIAIWKSYR